MKVGRLAPLMVSLIKGAIAALLALASLHSNAAGLGGTISGSVAQEGDAGVTYLVKMELYGSVGNVDYPTLHCGGKVELLREEGDTFWYVEHITYGRERCHDDGTVAISPAATGEPTTWNWRREAAGIASAGVVYGAAVKNES